MSDALTVSLVGRMHRTVYVEGCNPSFYDELAMLFAKKCGALEARGMVGQRYAVVFQSVNSVSNAVALHGMSFMDLQTKLCIWPADKSPPAEAAQLSLTGPAGSSGDSGSERSARSEEHIAARKARIEAFLRLAGGPGVDGRSTSTSSGNNIITTEEKRLWQFRLCVRQMRALNVILESEVKKIHNQRDALRGMLEMTESVVERLRSQVQ